MRVETVMAEAGLRPRVALEIESVSAMLDLVQRHALHAVLPLNAVRGRAGEAQLNARPIRTVAGQLLATTLYIATSAQRPRGPLLDQATGALASLLKDQLQER